jgi:hypothetical protein
MQRKTIGSNLARYTELAFSQLIGSRSMLMGKSDPVAIERWLKKRYKLLFLRINERTDHAFAIVDLAELPSTYLNNLLIADSH